MLLRYLPVLLAPIVLMGAANAVTITVVPEAIPSAPVPLDGYTDYALWGVTDPPSQEAERFKGEWLISPNVEYYSAMENPLSARGPLSPARWRYSIDGQTVYGALGISPVNSPVIGDGFSLVMIPSMDAVTNYEIWALSWNGTASVEAKTFMGEVLQSAPLPYGFYGRVLLEATGDPFRVEIRTTSGTGGYDGANVTFGAVTAQVQAVPEPGLIAAGVLVLALVLWYRAALWIDRQL